MADRVYQKQYVSQCVVCHTDFTHYTKVRLCLCSKQCRGKWRTAHRGEPRVEKACLVCETTFLPKSKKSQKFCSNSCRHKYRGKLQTQKGKGFRVNRKILYYKPCAYCGKEFGVVAADRATCCSRECGFQYATYLRFTNETWLAQRAVAHARKALLKTLHALRACGYCAKKYLAKPISREFCSRICTVEGYKQRSRETHVWAIGYADCKQCHHLFVTYWRRTIYCSHVCSKKAENNTKLPYKQLRRMRYRTQIRERFRKQEIWERDGYVCQMCHKKTRHDYHVRHNLYPSIDHIIPLALGGYHERRNVRTVHRGCNSRKQARAMNDQLLLIG
jgi:hypothetical protein